MSRPAGVCRYLLRQRTRDLDPALDLGLAYSKGTTELAKGMQIEHRMLLASPMKKRHSSQHEPRLEHSRGVGLALRDPPHHLVMVLELAVPDE